MSTARKAIKSLKITGIILGILLALLTGFHFWFKANARRMLEDLVSTRSGGTLKLKLEKFRFGYFSKKMRLENAVFYTDSTQPATAYRFSIEKIELRAKAILPLVFQNEFQIDSILLIKPIITVTRNKPIPKADKQNKEDVSIPEEMGNVYRSIQDAMKFLKIQRFEIADGRFSLINKIDTSQLPLHVSKIRFQIDNFQVDEQFTGTHKILFGDNVILNAQDQDIIMPDGRHRLSFSRFNINLKNKLVTFDSCRIAATKTESNPASFSVFFDVLNLTKIDFDTLYNSEVIKADSVYCLNPQFTLDVETVRKKGGATPPRLENIIRQLTGDLLLDFVVVHNAAFNIRTVRDGVPNSYQFSNNNFDMQGLRVVQSAEAPVSVKSFNMSIRNYENFIKDSTYSIRFDSVVFRNDRILLNNFLFEKLNNGKILNTFSIPQFTLTGLSWNDLVFENKLKASQAVMFHPFIRYSVSEKLRKKGGVKIFQSLGVLNEYMDLQHLDIKGGTIDLTLRNNLRVQLRDADVSVKSQSLLESTKLDAIKNSLEHLRLSKGIIHAGNLDLELQDIIYTGNSGSVIAGKIIAGNQQKVSELNGVTIQKLLVDEKTGDLFADGLHWKSGTIDAGALAVGRNESSVLLKSVFGTNTLFNGPIGNHSVSTHLNKIQFSLLEKKPGNILKLDGLMTSGSRISVTDSGLHAETGAFTIHDGGLSNAEHVVFQGKTFRFTAPMISFHPHFFSFAGDSLFFDEFIATKPVLRIDLQIKNEPGTNPFNFPKIGAGKIILNNPSLYVKNNQKEGSSILQWEGEKSKENFLELTGVHSSRNKITLHHVKSFLSGLTYTFPNGKKFATGTGSLKTELGTVQFSPEGNGALNWQAILHKAEFADLLFDNTFIKNGTIHLESGTMEKLNIGSDNIRDFKKLVLTNNYFRIHNLTGMFRDNTNQWSGYNLGYNRDENILRMDSFDMRPILQQDSFLARKKFATDYMTFKTGQITAGPVNLDKLILDTILQVRRIQAAGFQFSDFIDRRMPAYPEKLKKLPTDILKSIPIKLELDSVQWIQSALIYSEQSKKTGRSASVPITAMHVLVTGVKNYELNKGDSLYITASGLLLNKAPIRLSVRQSYLDSLSGLLLNIDMKSVDARLFNEILLPLESIQIVSGVADSVRLTAQANDRFAKGDMSLFYHDLKILILPIPPEKNNFKTKLKNLLANAFAIRDNNSGRNGFVFFIRDRQRSAASYLVKIALSGIQNSVGAAGTKKLYRKYKKQLKVHGLPPVEFD